MPGDHLNYSGSSTPANVEIKGDLFFVLAFFTDLTHEMIHYTFQFVWSHVISYNQFLWEN